VSPTTHHENADAVHRLQTERCCERDCKTREQMEAVHGTPQDFWEELLDAQEDGFVTLAEAQSASDRYVRLYNAAPEQDESVRPTQKGHA
jgi:hypothetical protein